MGKSSFEYENGPLFHMDVFHSWVPHSMGYFWIIAYNTYQMADIYINLGFDGHTLSYFWRYILIIIFLYNKEDQIIFTSGHLFASLRQKNVSLSCLFPILPHALYDPRFCQPLSWWSIVSPIRVNLSCFLQFYQDPQGTKTLLDKNKVWKQ